MLAKIGHSGTSDRELGRNLVNREHVVFRLRLIPGRIGILIAHVHGKCPPVSFCHELLPLCGVSEVDLRVGDQLEDRPGCIVVLLGGDQGAGLVAAFNRSVYGVQGLRVGGCSQCELDVIESGGD